MAKAYCTDYFTGKVSQLPINLQKLQNFPTLNNLQYTVCILNLKTNSITHVHTYVCEYMYIPYSWKSLGDKNFTD